MLEKFWYFDGWYTDEGYTNKAPDQITVNDSAIYYAALCHQDTC